MELNCGDWMSSLPEELWDVPLTHLAIPGTHAPDLHLSSHNTHILPAGYDNGTQNNAATLVKICGNMNSCKFSACVNPNVCGNRTYASGQLCFVIGWFKKKFM